MTKWTATYQEYIDALTRACNGAKLTVREQVTLASLKHLLATAYELERYASTIREALFNDD